MFHSEQSFIRSGSIKVDITSCRAIVIFSDIGVVKKLVYLPYTSINFIFFLQQTKTSLDSRQEVVHWISISNNEYFTSLYKIYKCNE